MKCDTVGSVIKLNNEIGPELLKKSLTFVMKEDIKPIWEDVSNIKGGSFSFKIHNKDIDDLWKHILYLMIGGTMMKNKNNMHNVNGISLSPKKTFCILKIWMLDCSLTNCNIFEPIVGIDYKGCLFKKH